MQNLVHNEEGRENTFVTVVYTPSTSSLIVYCIALEYPTFYPHFYRLDAICSLAAPRLSGTIRVFDPTT